MEAIQMIRRLFRTRNRAGSRRGQSLVEFSFVMPILLITVTGMLSFGITMHNYLTLTNGVNTGAQVLAMSRGQTTDPCATALTTIEQAAPGLTGTNVSLTVVVNGTSFSGSSCTGGASDMIQGTLEQVTATYPCVLAIYGMGVPACSLRSQASELIQ
jgi:Flp pilus assembly protein TadG